MAEINEKQAQEILEKHGYKVLGYLGSGAASHAFKVSRVSKKGGEKIVAAKVCCPQSGSFASLEEELTAANELKQLKKSFELQIAEATRSGQGKLAQKYKKAKKHLFKYLNVPKLKLHPPEEIMDDGKSDEIAIFEAPLADSDLHSYEVGSGISAEAKYTIMPDPENPDKYTCVMNVDIDYKELKRAIKSILKGLKAIHSQGKTHGDIRASNVLKTFDAEKGKFKYALTDFGTLGKGSILTDLENASKMFLGFWYRFLGKYPAEIYEIIESGYTLPSLEKNGYAELTVPREYFKKFRVFTAKYFLTDEDKEFVRFDKKLFTGEFTSAEEALADPWIKSSSK